MNLLDANMGGLDSETFQATLRGLFPLVGVLWLGLVARTRRAGLLLLGVLLANVWLWAATNLPLQRPYGLGASNDRLNNLALCQVVASEGRPLETFLTGQLHFEPFWGLLVATASGFDTERVLALYPYFSLLMAPAFALALFFGLRRPDEGADGPWERAVVAGFATLLSSAPLEFLGTYRVPWATMFLLKPNHSLALALVPLLIWGLARMQGGFQRVLAGLWLQLIGWAFVIHMGLAALGLILFGLESWWTRRVERRREWIDVLVVVSVNLLIVSPYLAMLLVGYPFTQATRRHVIPASSPHVIEATLYAGWMALLTLWGFVVLRRRGDRLSRLWAAQWLAGLLVWVAYLGLSPLQLARELDEGYQWLRFVGAVLAGVGAWDLCARAARAWRSVTTAPFSRAVALSALVLPLALPSFWDPFRMDPFFAPALEPLPANLVAPAQWLRAHSRPGDVVAGDHDFAPWAAALAGRRSLISNRFHLPPAFQERLVLEHDLVSGVHPARTRALARRYRVRFLTVTRPMLQRQRLSLEALKKRPDLSLGYEASAVVRGREPLAIFELNTGGSE